MQPQMRNGHEAGEPRPMSSQSPTSSNAHTRLAPVTSAINGILKAEPTDGMPVDAISISRQIMAALENLEHASPLPSSGTGTALDDSPCTFVMRMPPSDSQLKALAARQQQHKQEAERQKQTSSPSKDSSFAFDDVPSIADFDIPAIANTPSLHAK